MTYPWCAECQSYDCDGRYHECIDCPTCDTEGTVVVYETQKGDEWLCGSCHAVGAY